MPGTLLQFRFKTDSDREEVMRTIESIRATSIYPHPPEDCTPECKERGRLMQEWYFCIYYCQFTHSTGCGTLWVTDGIWKLTFPHCMHSVKVCYQVIKLKVDNALLISIHLYLQYLVKEIPALSMPDVCTNQPAPGKAFCTEHSQLLQSQSPPIPTELRSFLKYCGIIKGMSIVHWKMTSSDKC